MPSICIRPSEISKQKLLHLNLTNDGYRKKGHWRSQFRNLDEEETYNELSTTFEDLIEKIVVRRGIDDVSDANKKVTLRKIEVGILLDRCDYNSALKCFCINFSGHHRIHAIQSIYLYLKM